MYIGPWQEFKLARILQLKDKVNREDNEANQLPQPQQPKAYSVQNGRQLNSGRAPPFSQAGSAGFGKKVDSAAGSDFFMHRNKINQQNMQNIDSYSNYSNSNMGGGNFGQYSNDGRTANTTIHQITSKKRKQKLQVNSGKFKLSQEFQPPQKKVEVLKAYDKKPAMPDRLFQGVHGKGKNQSKASSVFGARTTQADSQFSRDHKKSLRSSRKPDDMGMSASSQSLQNQL